MVLASLGPTAHVTLGPYVLNSSNPGVSLSLPDCSIVSVDWGVVSGPSVNFSVGQGGALGVSNCHNYVLPSNATCPVAYCGLMNAEPGPICFETGFGGTCSFTATQPSYGFGAIASPWSIGNATVTFTVHYSITRPIL